MVIDTDVLIWYMKGNKNAYKTIEDSKSFYISVVTYMELVQGMRDKNELYKLRRALHVWNSKILYISEDISVKAMFFVEQHYFKPLCSIGGCFNRRYGNCIRTADPDRQ